ncbi:MAG: NADP-specific glutamate dehydrogenase [Gammaproteobacteria bacterium]|nr:NADP-specific glutamate dehydrogenase [Gammaproteobacteria bacterium]
MIRNPSSLTITGFMDGVRRRNRGQKEFHQAVSEWAHDVIPFVNENKHYQDHNLSERLTEPDRIIIFRVTWEDDEGRLRVNKGYRVQHSNAIGPYKGGLRFHPSVSLSVLKFLAFEQVFKNSLTGLPMGGAKGGSNFDPKGKSNSEIMRFCQAFMSELHRHIGPFTDVPAGDIGVGSREISYLFGQYKRICNQFTGVLTGKGLSFGGSEIRVEATGYGTIYFMEDMLRHHKQGIEDKTCLVSGSGNVAIYATEKLIQHGAKPVTLSDSGGFIHDPEGIDADKLAWVKELKEVRYGRISEYADEFGVKYYPGERPWGVPCDLAFPCATQNEVDGEEAKILVKNGCIGVAEGANMGSNNDAISVFRDAKILYGPPKAANAGGVAVSGLEMTQNSMRMNWSRKELNTHLGDIMRGIHERCVEYGTEKDGYVDYLKGANIAGFKKVADALIAYGAS